MWSQSRKGKTKVNLDETLYHTRTNMSTKKKKEVKIMTVKELEANKSYRVHHTATRRGYESRKGDGHVEEYNGRFGKGYIAVTPRYDTTMYVYITYYIAE